MPKLTFSLDDAAVRALQEAARRTRKPQSAIVREAIARYASEEDMLPPDERDRLLEAVRRIKRRSPTRPPAAVDRELQELRRSRRAGWSRP
jgi:hypothetical protein